MNRERRPGRMNDDLDGRRTGVPLDAKLDALDERRSTSTPTPWPRRPADGRHRLRRPDRPAPGA
jgi:hypothetical protein